MPVITDLKGPAGQLEALLDEPTSAPIRAAVVFAHPHPQHGGTMHTKTVYQGAKGLARIGCAVLRFNFRGVGASDGTFDRGEGEKADFAAALDYMAAKYPGTPLWAAGFSFGSWVALTVGAEDPRVQLMLGIGPAIDRYDFAAFKQSEKQKILIHGEFDELIPLREVKKFYAQLREPKDLVVIDAADHLFNGKTMELGQAVEDLLGDASLRSTKVQ